MTKQQIISRFVYKERLRSSFDWAREMKILKGLMQEYPELPFWENVDLGFHLNSLAWFKSEDGINKLATLYFEYNQFRERFKSQLK